MQLTSPTVLLKQLVSPPATELVEAAITELSDVGAVDSNHEDGRQNPWQLSETAAARRHCARRP